MGKLTNSKIKMLALYTTCLLLSIKMEGQSIYIKNVKPENIARAKFNFEVTNSSDTIKVYTVSLEKQETDNNWHEIKGDVFNTTPTKKTRTFRITGNGSVKHFFYPSKIIGNNYKHRKYRLKIKYGNDFNDKTLILYSDSFVFK